MVASDAVQRLVKNRQSREVAPPLSESVPDMTLEQAYAIQRMLEKILVERGDRVVGWKAGFTNAALQEGYGVTEPVLAFLLASGVFASGDAVPVSRFVSLGLEVGGGLRHEGRSLRSGRDRPRRCSRWKGPCRPSG
jgi:2-keto-4-pentenoate hydratase